MATWWRPCRASLRCSHSGRTKDPSHPLGRIPSHGGKRIPWHSIQRQGRRDPSVSRGGALESFVGASRWRRQGFLDHDQASSDARASGTGRWNQARIGRHIGQPLDESPLANEMGSSATGAGVEALVDPVGPCASASPASRPEKTPPTPSVEAPPNAVTRGAQPARPAWIVPPLPLVRARDEGRGARGEGRGTRQATRSPSPKVVGPESFERGGRHLVPGQALLGGHFEAPVLYQPE